MNDKDNRHRSRDPSDVSASTDLLAARLRSGLVSQVQIRLAATLGFTPATPLLTGPTPDLTTSLVQAGPEALLRGLAAALRAAARVPPLSWRDTKPLPASLNALDGWILSPSGRSLEVCRRTGGSWDDDELPGSLHSLIGEPERASSLTEQTLHGCAEELANADYPRSGQEVVRDALAADLLPWILGHRDPVAARHLRDVGTLYRPAYSVAYLRPLREVSLEAHDTETAAIAAALMALDSLATWSSREEASAQAVAAQAELQDPSMRDYLGLAIYVEAAATSRTSTTKSDAIERLEQAAQFLEAGRHRSLRLFAAKALEHRADLRRELGDAPRGYQADLTRAAAIHAEGGPTHEQAGCLRSLSSAALAADGLQAAASYAEQALEVDLAVPQDVAYQPNSVSWSHDLLASLRYKLGDPEGATKHHREYLRLGQIAGAIPYYDEDAVYKPPWEGGDADSPWGE